MTRMSRPLSAAAIMLMSGIAVSDVHAQSTGADVLICLPHERANTGAASCRSRCLP